MKTNRSSKKSSKARNEKSNPVVNAKRVLALITQAGDTLSLPASEPTVSERHTLRSVRQRTPRAVIDQVIGVAERQSVDLLGIVFDPAEAQATLAEVSALESIASTASSLARRVRTASLVKYAALAQHADAVASAMGKVSKLPDGDALRTTYAPVASAKPRRARRAKPQPPVKPAPAPAPAVAAAPASATTATSPSTTEARLTVTSGASPPPSNGAAHAGT